MRYTVACLGIITSMLFTAPSVAQTDSPPNFVIILADDLGLGDIAPYGNKLINTPHLTRMAQEGSLLTSFYSSAGVCTPSRGGLLMGQYPARNRLTADVARPSNKIGIPDDAVTIADVLRNRGYATACIGKWHLGHRPNQWPTAHGFDYFYGVPWSNDMSPFELYRNSEKIESPVDQTTITERYTDEAIKFIEEHQDEPFFVYLPHSMPHVPLFVSEEFENKSKAGLYGDVVEAIDWSVGEIMATLERLNLDENTMLIFTSDNGPWFEGSAGRYRNRKGSAWDGGMRVPMLTWWPGRIKGGTTSNAISMNIDLLPTLVKLADAKLPEDRPIDGKDIWPLIQGNAESPHEFLYMFFKNDIAAVRTQRWKLVHSTMYRNWYAKVGVLPYYRPGLLFDMENHPEELYSMTRENPDVAKELRAILEDGQRTLEPLAKKK
ncbi:MAG: sulfatase [Candidatus Hydrogenedentota bacterium]